MLLSIIHVYLLVVITSYVPAAAQIDAECFTDYLGRDYRGNVSTTNTGKTCQRWTSQYPHSHSRTPSNYPDAGLGNHNNCRNPIGWKDGVYCFTTDSSVRAEECDIGNWQVTCDKGIECFTDYLGRDYRGTVSTTNTGKTCQQWIAQSPYLHIYTPSNYSDAGLGDHNYCRNPDDDKFGAWCYITDNSEHYEKCDIGPWQATCDRADRCQADYTPFQDSCYKLHTETRTRAEAEEDCEPQGHLVDITSSEENDFVNRLLDRTGTKDAWFGLLKTDVLIWSDGTPPVYRGHDIRQDGGGTCFHLDKDVDRYVWNDGPCNTEYHFVCERDETILCPDGWSAYQSSCYYLSQYTWTWFEAYDNCQDPLKGHLVDITSMEEQQFIENLMSKADIDDAWFGLQRGLGWSNGSPLDEQSWQYIYQNEESICFRIREDGWYDRSCDNEYRFLCETEANDLPSTNTDSSITERPVDTGSIAGGVVGAIVVIALISFILFIIYRRKNRETPSPSPKLEYDGPYDITLQGTNVTTPGSSGGTSHPNQAYEPKSAIGGKGTDVIYYDVKDQSEEYGDADADNNPQQHSDDQTYTYADIGSGSSPPAPSVKPVETSQDNEGWKENSIYVASDEDMNGLSTDVATKQGEGWVANSIYGD